MRRSKGGGKDVWQTLTICSFLGQLLRCQVCNTSTSRTRFPLLGHILHLLGFRGVHGVRNTRRPCAIGHRRRRRQGGSSGLSFILDNFGRAAALYRTSCSGAYPAPSYGSEIHMERVVVFGELPTTGRPTILRVRRIGRSVYTPSGAIPLASGTRWMYLWYLCE